MKLPVTAFMLIRERAGQLEKRLELSVEEKKENGLMV